MRKLPQEIKNYPVGTQVAYLSDAKYKRLTEILTDLRTQYGFITGGSRERGFFVRFWNPDLKDLRTKGNSETCYWDDLLYYTSVPKEQVKKALKWISQQLAEDEIIEGN